MNNLKAIFFHTLFATLLIGMMASCNSRSKKYVIAVVQCSQDSWREKLNAELQAATYFYDNVELRFANANDSVELQKRLLKQYADSGVDMIIVAPITSTDITSTVEQLMGFAADATSQAGAVAVMTVGVVYLCTIIKKISI